MNNVKEKLDGLEKIEKEEREELKSLLRQVMQDENKSGAKEIYNDVDEFLSLNKKIVDLTEYIEENPGKFIEVLEKIETIERQKENLKKNLVEDLRKLNVPDKFVNRLIKTDERLEEIDEQLINEVKEKRNQQAEKIIEEKTTIFFEASALNNFTESVKKNQVEREKEVPGVFEFESNNDGYYLKEFLQLENVDGTRGSFILEDEVRHVIEEFGNNRNIIIAHSHPRRDFQHSTDDQKIVRQANGIGLIGVPSKDYVYPVPEKLNFEKRSNWEQLPSKVVHNGSVLKEDELKEKFYPVWDYNQALKKAIIEGAEGGWSHYINE